MKDNDKVQCPICLKYYKSLATGHLIRKHALNSEELLKLYPNTQLSSTSMLAYRGSKIKATWDTKSEDQKQAFSNKMSETMSVVVANLAPAAKKNRSESSRSAMQRRLSVMTEDERKQYSEFHRAKAKKQDLTAFKAGRKAGYANWLSSLKTDPEAYAAYCTKLSKSQHARFASMTAEELKVHMLRSLCPRKDTAPELFLLETITLLGYASIPQYKIGRHQVDAYIPSINLVVEMYGDYWHAGPGRFSENDILHPTSKEPLESIRSKDNARAVNISSLGYKILVIWESEILANTDFLSFLSQKISTVIPSQA